MYKFFNCYEESLHLCVQTCKICMKLHRFLEKFTQLTKILHDRRSRKISSLPLYRGPIIGLFSDIFQKKLRHNFPQMGEGVKGDKGDLNCLQQCLLCLHCFHPPLTLPMIYFKIKFTQRTLYLSSRPKKMKERRPTKVHQKATRRSE